MRSLYIDGLDNNALGSELKWQRHASGLTVTPQDSIQWWQDTLLRLVNCQSFRLYTHFTPCRASPPNIITPSEVITIFLSIVIARERPVRELSILFKPPSCVGRNQVDLFRVDVDLLREPKIITTCFSLEVILSRYTMDTEETVDLMTQLIQHATKLQ